MSKKIWVPREHKQKEVVAFRLPWLGWPITGRLILYAALGIIPAYLFLYIAANIFHPTRLEDRVTVYVIAAAIPVGMAMLSTMKVNDKYFEDVLKTKLKYKKSSGVNLNEKALAAVREKEGR